MSAAVKPATPLPWAVGMRGGANGNMIVSHTGEGMHDDPAICQMYGISMNRRVEELQDADGMPNARYLVHAANAYPKLVEALREFLDLCPHMNDDDPIAPALAHQCRRVRAILRDLGEAK